MSKKIFIELEPDDGLETLNDIRAPDESSGTVDDGLDIPEFILDSSKQEEPVFIPPETQEEFELGKTVEFKPENLGDIKEDSGEDINLDSLLNSLINSPLPENSDYDLSDITYELPQPVIEEKSWPYPQEPSPQENTAGPDSFIEPVFPQDIYEGPKLERKPVSSKSDSFLSEIWEHIRVHKKQILAGFGLSLTALILIFAGVYVTGNLMNPSEEKMAEKSEDTFKKAEEEAKKRKEESEKANEAARKAREEAAKRAKENGAASKEAESLQKLEEQKLKELKEKLEEEKEKEEEKKKKKEEAAKKEAEKALAEMKAEREKLEEEKKRLEEEQKAMQEQLEKERAEREAEEARRQEEEKRRQEEEEKRKQEEASKPDIPFEEEDG